MDTTELYNLSPLASMILLGCLLALGPLIWIAWRYRHAGWPVKLRALTLLTLFLTFDLVLFGAFTRLTDSGLGCPDWPGCYGSVSPLGARQEIDAAQTALPTGPVTHKKAWIEMIHRYWATAVGLMSLVLAIASWVAVRRRRAAISPWWATLTWFGFCLQGAFGALTVTMKLYPAIVTAHLLGGIGLLALLTAQSEAYTRQAVTMSKRLAVGVLALLGLSVVQVALGGWVSTNYAVLACTDFPTCQNSWWPAMDFEHGFTLFRELGAGKEGGYLPFAALTAIHMVHRWGAAIVLSAMALLAWRLMATGQHSLQRWAWGLLAIGAWQFFSGLSNVVLGWPLVAAVAHTGGAAALIVLLTALSARAWRGQRMGVSSLDNGRVQAGTDPTATS